MPKTNSERRPRSAPPPAPDAASLRVAALLHLGRYAATETGLVRVLERRIARWAREPGADAEIAADARQIAREVAHGLVEAGMIDDVAFAAARSRRLVRSGRSRRAVAAHLMAKGVDADAAQAAMPDPQAEALAALSFAKRRRIGPFSTNDAEDPARALAALARAGFPREIAEAALRTDRDEAEQRLLALKQG